ncbi:MAG TPA: hypothetical protein VGM91_11485 [Conexibacter sp.]|jgi:hypothetical protein
MTHPDPIDEIARAVLYEGYVLWPYRRSAVKNRQRWTFGGVFPPGWTDDGHPDDPSHMQTQCLVIGPDDATLEIEIRFLHVVERHVTQRTAARLEPVDELTVDGQRHLSWEEATERWVAELPLSLAELRERRQLKIDVPSGQALELLGPGGTAGALLRGWGELTGEIVLKAEPLTSQLHRVTVRIVNTTPWKGAERADALRHSLVSTHTVLRAAGAEFVSLTDPPAALEPFAGTCENDGTWPALVGPVGSNDIVLSSPILLEDHPRIAPESPGDLFDGGEIDELLILNILSLTDEERQEARASDPRTRELIERCEGLTPQQLMQLHGRSDLRAMGER